MPKSLKGACISWFLFKSTNFAQILKRFAQTYVFTSSTFRSSASSNTDTMCLFEMGILQQIQTRDDRTRTKIRRNFRFRPVLPGFGFVHPFFARFLPSFARFCLKMPVFCPVRLVSSKFTRIRSVSFVPCLPGFGYH